jgi:uncharacterized membrane protein
MKLLAGAMALIIAAAGVVGIVSPSLVLELARSLLVPGALYVVAAVRVIFGIVLVLVASASRLPKTIRVLGIIITVAGVLTPFFGVERSHAVFDWWSSQSALFMRAWSGLAVLFGLFVIYALTPRRQAAA